MENNERLKTLKIKLFFARLFSFLFTICPLIVYVIIGFANGDIQKGEKIFLGFTVILVIMLTLLNILMKYHLRSPLFILLLGIYFALEKILPLLIILSIGIIIDEFILTPVIKNLKQKVIVRKELEYGGNS